MRELAEGLDGVLVVDEAYVDFVDPALGHDAVELVRGGAPGNVVLLRSLSKGYALAGLRFGYGIGPVDLIEPMQSKTKDSYNTDAVSQRLAEAAIVEPEVAAANWAAVRRERARVSAALAEMGFEVPGSESNFVLARAPEGRAAALYEALKQRGIFVRYFDDAPLEDKLRITIGAPTENDALLGALRELL
jgi:histidinol-phosphate aminotransferase